MLNENRGHIHPLNAISFEVEKVLSNKGFKFVYGKEVDTEYYNFDALNIPKNHPARELWDTFWIKGVPNTLLRTHTSNVQAHYLEEHKDELPIRIASLGKVFRNEATDNSHEAQFIQCEGLYVDENVTIGHLKQTINSLIKELFGDDIELRYRPSYFPFVEPGIEVDMKRVGSDKWLEILGAGMVHPNVLSNAGIDPKKYKGFAFGIGIDRVAMLRHNIDDVRLFHNGDVRFVSSFYEV